jgi:ParB-like chromosome segregation protein Spo0J
MEITHDVKLSTLKPHPLNAEIYGEPDKKLMEDIEKNGLLTPIVINSKNVIISGHRRWKAMLALGFTATDAIIRDFQDELDEQEKLIAYNQQREKTASQIFAEAEKLKEIVRERARRRQATSTGGSNPQLKNLEPEAEKGQTRDIIAKKIGAGMAGGTLERGLRIYEAAKQGNEQAQESLKKLDRKESTITTEFKKLFKSEERKVLPQPQISPPSKVVKNEEPLPSTGAAKPIMIFYDLLYRFKNALKSYEPLSKIDEAIKTVEVVPEPYAQELETTAKYLTELVSKIEVLIKRRG